jgi:outer membrane protein assembly factor BamD (BamD/ComL family)
LLVLSEGYIGTVQAALGSFATLESDSPYNEALKVRLIQEVNKRPDNSIFAEMLIWLYLQEQNYKQAARQALALDKRQEGTGHRVYGVAGIAFNNARYSDAVEICDITMANFKESSVYPEARVLKLTAGFEQLRQGGKPNKNEIESLTLEYRKALLQIDDSESKAQLMGRLAHIEAYYLLQPDTALDIFEEALALPGLNNRTVANLKLDYGDLLLASGFIWDASLMYGQVEKDFKYDVIGDEAKYRGARISFYNGEFQLASAHLDILKGSTSKYIANDALYLSVLISDNSTVDTSTEPLEMFAQADLLIFQKQFSRANKFIDSIAHRFPGHSLQDDLLFLKYKIAYEAQSYQEAAGYLQKIFDEFSYEILADKSLFLLAELSSNHLNDKERAETLYERLLVDFKDSVYTAEARKRLRSLRGDQNSNTP